MPNSCTLCKNNSSKNQGISFFTYPSELVRRHNWLKAVGREDLTEKLEDVKRRSNYRICEQHFETNFITVSKYRKVKHLSEDAFPSLKIPSNDGVTTPSAAQPVQVTLPSPTSTRGIVARTSVSADDVAQDQLLHIKEELEDADLDIGPTVLQHMDSRYISHQIDLNAIKQESTIRLDAGEVVSGIKDVQELHSAVRDGTIEDSQTDNKIILCKYSGQIIKEEDFGQAPVKPCLGRQTDHHLRLQRQYRAVSSNGFKCEASDRTFLKPHLLSVHNKLHQQCSSKTSMMSSSIALGPSNLRRDETAKVKKNSFECEKPYYCDMCDARFAYKPALIDHTRIHTGAKPYHCNKCDARFSQNFTLIRHMKVHTGEKPYHCDTCDARFTQKRSLFLHMTIHTGEKPFHCNTCDARFARKLYLIKHMSVHTEKKPYHCDTCDRGFTRKIALTMHMIIHTGEGVPL